MSIPQRAQRSLQQSEVNTTISQESSVHTARSDSTERADGNHTGASGYMRSGLVDEESSSVSSRVDIDCMSVSEDSNDEAEDARVQQRRGVGMR